MQFFLLINVKVPIFVDILTLSAGKKSCSAELNMEFLYNLGAWTVLLICFVAIVIHPVLLSMLSGI